MRFNKNDIELQLAGETCQPNKCKEFAERTTSSILERKSAIFIQESNLQQPDEVISAINKLLVDDSLVVIYLDTGSVDGNPNYRALHSYIIFGLNPMEAFVGWQSGIEFVDENDLVNSIANTLRIGSKIDVQQYR